jgi:hypothetical protein
MQFGNKGSKSNERKADSKSPAVKKRENQGVGVMSLPKQNLFGEEKVQAGD